MRSAVVLALCFSVAVRAGGPTRREIDRARGLADGDRGDAGTELDQLDDDVVLDRWAKLVAKHPAKMRRAKPRRRPDGGDGGGGGNGAEASACAVSSADVPQRVGVVDVDDVRFMTWPVGFFSPMENM